MKTRLTCLGLFAMLMANSPAPAMAQAERSPLDALPVKVEFAGSAAFATDYVFNGISLSKNSPAVSGDIGWTLSDIPLSPSFGMFASSLDGIEGGAEIDYILGVSQTIDPLTLSVGWVYYQYPGVSGEDSALKNEAGEDCDTPSEVTGMICRETNEDVGDPLDFYEVTVGLDADFDLGSLGFYYAFSPDYYGSSGLAHYMKFGWDLPIPVAMLDGLSLTGNVGYQIVEDNDVFGVPDYLHWGVGLGYALNQFDFAIAYSDTELSEDECFGGDNVCGARAVFSMGVNF